MEQTLRFPGLGLELTMNPIAFSIGPVEIHWYGIIIAVAFLAAMAYALTQCKTFGVNPDRALDVIMGSFVAGLIGARLYYVVMEWPMYADNPISALYIWEGGIGIYGGLIFGFLFGIVMCRWRKVRMLPMMDTAGPALLLAQAIGRWGNFVNIEAYGGNTTLPWGMTSDKITAELTARLEHLTQIGMTIDPTQPVHPTFLYESLWNLLGFVLIVFLLIPRRRFDGQVFLAYCGWYGFGRFFIEGLRTDSLMIGNIRTSQLVALVCVVAAGVAMAVVLKKIKDHGDDPDYLPLYVTTLEGQMAVSGELYSRRKTDDGEILEEAQADLTAEDAAPAGGEASPEEEASPEDPADEQVSAAEEDATVEEDAPVEEKAPAGEAVPDEEDPAGKKEEPEG